MKMSSFRAATCCLSKSLHELTFFPNVFPPQFDRRSFRQEFFFKVTGGIELNLLVPGGAGTGAGAKGGWASDHEGWGQGGEQYSAEGNEEAAGEERGRGNEEPEEAGPGGAAGAIDEDRLPSFDES